MQLVKTAFSTMYSSSLSNAVKCILLQPNMYDLNKHRASNPNDVQKRIHFTSSPRRKDSMPLMVDLSMGRVRADLLTY